LLEFKEFISTSKYETAMPRKFYWTALILILTWFETASVTAQRDPPVFDCSLPRINLFKERTKLDLELTFQKAGGPTEQSPESQVYILGYLEKDELRILELAADDERTDKNKSEKLFLDELLKERLVVQLDTKIAPKAKLPLVTSPQSGRTLTGGYCYDFAFGFENSKLFEAIGGLKNFDKSNYIDSDNRYFNDKFKLLVFVPVNDCKYATLVSEKQRAFYDFAHFMDSKTVIQYCRPLPYRFQFKVLDKDGTVLLYVD
jgi:hypothetical protein